MCCVAQQHVRTICRLNSISDILDVVHRRVCPLHHAPCARTCTISRYAVARAADYDTLLAIGCVLCGCAPGGTTSNLFTYWAHGNVALSIVMSAASTLCATFMIPLLVLVYIESTYSTDDSIKLDYPSLFITLALILVPAAVGMWIRNSDAGAHLVCGAPVWECCERTGGVLGALFLVAVLVFALATQSEFLDQGADVWIPGLLFEPVGCVVGFVLATFARLDAASRRAVSLETGVQNYTFVIAVVALSYKDDCHAQERALVFPYVASVCYIVNSVWICAVFHYVSLPGTCIPNESNGHFSGTDGHDDTAAESKSDAGEATRGDGKISRENECAAGKVASTETVGDTTAHGEVGTAEARAAAAAQTESSSLSRERGRKVSVI